MNENLRIKLQQALQEKKANKKLALLLTKLEMNSVASGPVLDAYRDAIMAKAQSEEESPPSRLPEG